MYRLLIIIILPLVLLASACSKDKKTCWGCVLVFSDGYVASYRDSMICDKTQGEISDMKGMVYDAGAQGFRTMEINNCSRIR